MASSAEHSEVSPSIYGLDPKRMPEHVALIMDGNGRWAKAKGLPRVMGHRAGVEALKRTLRLCSDWGIRALTVYAFSTENWSRPSEEVNFLMTLFESVLKRELTNLKLEEVKINFLGDLDPLPIALKDLIKESVESTSHNKGIHFNVCTNYGGASEVDPDLLIRTSGEKRISNFLLWQLAYAEIHVTDVLWPDFNADTLTKALLDYQSRRRRFGGV